MLDFYKNLTNKMNDYYKEGIIIGVKGGVYMTFNIAICDDKAIHRNIRRDYLGDSIF